MPVVARGDIKQFYAGDITVAGATPATFTSSAIVPGSLIAFGLKTVGGTVGNTPTVKTITAGSCTIAATASDTSVYSVYVF